MEMAPPAAAKERTPIVEFRNIKKSFSGVTVLQDVSFKIYKGDVHCLMGENGAGKSTLIKIMTGVYRADEGEVLIDGKPVSVTSIQEGQNLGIGTVFQENSLIPHLTVAENVFLTREPRLKNGMIDYRKMLEETARWCRELGLELNPADKVRHLTVAEQQLVEIVKMFTQQPKLVVLDEPTSSLSDNEIARLFALVRRMQDRGVTFIYISHRMAEIQEIGTRGTVLRDGTWITDIEDVKTTDLNTIVRYIVGRELTQQYPPRDVPIGDVLLEVRNLSAVKLVNDVSFKVRRGEVLGFAGLVGAGRTETAKAIFGDLKKTSGTVLMDSRELHISSPTDAIREGIGLLPENRKEEGLFLTKSIAWNLSFASIERIKRGRFLNFGKERRLVRDYVRDLNIKTPSIDKLVKNLSGGNQQKVVFAKWLSAGSKVYIFDEPTRGIDVGAKREIYEIINRLAEQGNAIIVISSELPEVLGVCDTVAVFHEGELVKTLPIEEATQEAVMYYAMGGKDDKVD